jgi:hypothetical protein
MRSQVAQKSCSTRARAFKSRTPRLKAVIASSLIWRASW